MAWPHARQGMQCEDWQHERTGTRPLVCSWPPASLTKCACQADAARAQHREAGAGAGAAMSPIGNLTVGMTALALADFRTESPSVMPSTASVLGYHTTKMSEQFCSDLTYRLRHLSEYLTHAACHHGETARHHEVGSHERAAHHAH
jgi:hypothetical protein